MIYYTSDTHFNHKNIIEFCNRPFRTADGQLDVPAMNRHMIEAWNSRVTDEDLVIHGGDFGMGSWKEWAGFRAQLKGRLLLIKGNHDRKLEHWLKPGDFCLDSLLTRDGYFITHVPPGMPDHAQRYGPLDVHPVPPEAHTVIHGHTHHANHTQDGNLRYIAIGVDVTGYVPLTLDEILAKTEGLQWTRKPVASVGK